MSAESEELERLIAEESGRERKASADTAMMAISRKSIAATAASGRRPKRERAAS